MIHLTRTKALSETFEEASKIRIKADRINFLRARVSETMRYIVQGAYHPNVKWLLPAGTSHYRQGKGMDNEGVLFKKTHILYVFVEGDSSLRIPQHKREKLWLNFMESLYPSDAELMDHVKDKKLNYPYLTRSFFKECFPDWFQGVEFNDKDE